jgi:hypothetical protein
MERIFERFVESQGWNESSQVAILLRYIENQASPEAFEDFLQQQADEENGVDEFTAKEL